MQKSGSKRNDAVPECADEDCVVEILYDVWIGFLNGIKEGKMEQKNGVQKNRKDI